MPEFKNFAKLINEQFVSMQTDELYVVDIGDTDIFEFYLDAFPEGTNPIYRVRTEHDGSIDKHFIRRIGNVVAIRDGAMVSVWDVVSAEAPYDVVSQRMSELIKSLPIKNVFRTRENSYGNEETIELIEGNQTKKWFHLHTGQIAERYRTQDVEAVCGQIASVAGVFRRGLDELSLSAMTDVKELIQANTLYRGEEHLESLKRFIALKAVYDQPELTAQERDLFMWSNTGDRNARFRNTVIGTLVQDLSEGVDLERAVKGFETKVAPTNYKRPTALITPRMVEDAMTKIRDLDLEPALERRFAQLSDVSVNNVLFVDNSVQGTMRGGVQDLLMSEAKPTTPARNIKATPIGIDDFMSNILPGLSTIDVSLKNGHTGNFMSLTAPVRDDVQPLFKWSNNFAWSYDGNITDSIREKVKRAGGNVDATLRVSLAWFNRDDLDIHVQEPSGRLISFSNKCGILDVDMNAGGPSSREPVENMQWNGRVPDGEYRVAVNQYSKRESVDVGFVLEVEFDGNTQTFSHEKSIPHGRTIDSLRLMVRNGVLVDVKTNSPGVVSGSSSVEKWGVHTEQFVPVNTIMFSPNHWDDNATGNKHWFFILKDCVNPDRTRGIYNEFLKPELEQHRKVFEILGDKTKCEVTDNQLSGVGFSSTKREKLTVIADGRPYEIQF